MNSGLPVAGALGELSPSPWEMAVGPRAVAASINSLMEEAARAWQPRSAWFG